jgi:hypothetical protein
MAVRRIPDASKIFPVMITGMQVIDDKELGRALFIRASYAR